MTAVPGGPLVGAKEVITGGGGVIAVVVDESTVEKTWSALPIIRIQTHTTILIYFFRIAEILL